MTNSLYNNIILLATLIFSLAISSCQEKDELTPGCYQGTVIGKIRSNGGGLAVSVISTEFGTHQWRGYNNVVEALNLKIDYSSGTKIYFKARTATEQEKMYPITADGDESAKPIIYMTAVSTELCPN